MSWRQLWFIQLKQTSVILISWECYRNLSRCMARFGTTDSESVFSLPAKKSTLWRHQMEIFSALLAFCAGHSPVSGEFPAQRSVMRSFDVFFDLRLNEHLSKQSGGWWFKTPSRPLWRHSNAFSTISCTSYWIVSSLVLCCLSCVVSAGPFPHLQLTELILHWRHNEGDGVR